MKITSGLGSIDDYPRYVRAGADELFCGYVPFSWSEKYGTVLPLNRREVLNYNVQIGSFSELEILANMVQKYQKPVHLAFNSLYYRPEQYEEITQIIQQCRSIGFDSYILADPALLVYLRKEKIDCASRLRRADGYRLGRGNALRRRLHDRRHHLDGSATDPRRAGPGGRHRQDAAAVAARQADRSGRRQGTQGPFPASLPGRNDAADRPAARSRARAGSALRLGRAGQGGQIERASCRERV